VAHIVLDTDVVSLYRTGRLPAGFVREVAANDLSIAFATAGELWRWALARRWSDARRGALDAGLAEAQVWGEITTAAQRRGRRGRSPTRGSRPVASRTGCRC
jgi:hypothetical protein